MSFIDPKQVGLSARDRIEQISENRLALVIDRKSRIIMADGRRIMEKIRTIRATAPDVTVTLRTTAPVCGKTKAFLAGNGVTVEFV